MIRPEIEGLYAITPDIADTAILIQVTRHVLAGGARLVQYRNKISKCCASVGTGLFACDPLPAILRSPDYKRLR